MKIFSGSKSRARRARILLPLVLLAAAFALVFPGVGWWLDYSQEPEPADMIVALAGGYARPYFAAELYKKGFAPEVWISHPRPEPSLRLAAGLGIPVLGEDEINHQILLRRGVPEGRIHFYGHELRSTADEAMTLRETADLRGKRLLLVTSRPHARRAAITFRRILTEARWVKVTATPYEDFPRPWWRDQDMARWAVLELSKTAYFLAGGRFLAHAR